MNRKIYLNDIYAVYFLFYTFMSQFKRDALDKLSDFVAGKEEAKANIEKRIRDAKNKVAEYQEAIVASNQNLRRKAETLFNEFEEEKKRIEQEFIEEHDDRVVNMRAQKAEELRDAIQAEKEAQEERNEINRRLASQVAEEIRTLEEELKNF